MAIKIGVKIKIPKKLFKDIKIQKAVEDGLNKYSAPELIKLFEKTVEGWDTRPQFHSEVSVSTRNIILRVFPYGRGKSQYELVSSGSPPHTISAKKGGILRFQDGRGYIPSTTPGSLLSGKRKNSGNWIAASVVKHPGFKSRDFDVLISEAYEQDFQKDMQQAFNDAVKQF